MHLEEKANLDFRTGLLNHEAAKSRISAVFGTPSTRKHALVFFDLDNFKQANDVYGQPVRRRSA